MRRQGVQLHLLYSNVLNFFGLAIKDFNSIVEIVTFECYTIYFWWHKIAIFVSKNVLKICAPFSTKQPLIWNILNNVNNLKSKCVGCCFVCLCRIFYWKLHEWNLLEQQLFFVIRDKLLILGTYKLWFSYFVPKNMCPL